MKFGYCFSSCSFLASSCLIFIVSCTQTSFNSPSESFYFIAMSLLYHLEFAWTWYGFLVGTSLITRVDCVFVSYSIACLLGLSFCLFKFYSISYTYLVLFFLSSILLSNLSIAWLNFFLSVILSNYLESDSRG